jgi:transketolase
MYTIKPLDTAAICKAAQETKALVVAEEHSIIRGLGAAVAETLMNHCPVPVEQIGIGDTFTRTAHSPEELMDAFGLAVGDICRAGFRALEKKQAITK